jgi:hypothetical protein
VATNAKLDKFGHIDPSASGLASCDPPLALANLVGELALRQAGLLPHPPQKCGHSFIDNRLIPLRWHEAGLSTPRMLMRFKHIVLDAISASWDNEFVPEKSMAERFEWKWRGDAASLKWEIPVG